MFLKAHTHGATERNADVLLGPPLYEMLQGALDRAQPIRESIHDVKLTLIIAIGLVVAVIFIFLRNPSATVIPSLAVPISILGTFAVMDQLGYTLDNLSAMALTLSVGFVVDHDFLPDFF